MAGRRLHSSLALAHILPDRSISLRVLDFLRSLLYCLARLAGTYVEDLETGDIQHTDEVLTLLLGVQGGVDLGHHPLEQSVEHGCRRERNRMSEAVLRSIFERRKHQTTSKLVPYPLPRHPSSRYTGPCYDLASQTRYRPV